MLRWFGRTRLHGLLWTGLVAALLCFPAILNGFPLAFDDSAHYLRKPFAFMQEVIQGRFSTDAQSYRSYMPAHFGGTADTAVQPARQLSGNPFFLRPAPYSLALLPFVGGMGIMLIPFAQALLVVLLTTAVMRAILGPWLTTRALVGAQLILLASSAPWLASEIMPDVMTGCLALWLAYVICDDRPARWWHRVLLTGLGAFLIGTHLSHLALAFGAAIVGIGVRMAMARQGDPLLRQRLATVAAALLLAVGGLVGTNLAFGKRATLSESSPLFLQARFIGDGTAARVLEETCPVDDTWLLCRHPEFWSVSSDYFLWSPDAPWLRHWNERDRFLAEARQINSAVIQGHAWEQLGLTLTHWGEQLLSMNIDTQLAEPPKDSFIEIMRQMGGPLSAALEHSLQYADPRRLEEYRLLQDRMQQFLFALAILSLLVLGGAAWERRDGRLMAVACLAVTLVLGNAFLIGGLSAVHGRYQSRITWPVTLMATALGLASLRSRPSVERPAYGLPAQSTP